MEKEEDNPILISTAFAKVLSNLGTLATETKSQQGSQPSVLTARHQLHGIAYSGLI